VARSSKQTEARRARVPGRDGQHRRLAEQDWTGGKVRLIMFAVDDIEDVLARLR
jgi:hypothetical protein